MTSANDDDLLGPPEPGAELQPWPEFEVNWPIAEPIVGIDHSLLDPEGSELLEGPLHDVNYNGISDGFEH